MPLAVALFALGVFALSFALGLWLGGVGGWKGVGR